MRDKAMKKNIFFIIALCLLLLPLFGLDRTTFLSTGVDVDASSEQVTTSTSAKVNIAKANRDNGASIQVTFTRTAGTTATLDFEFQYSIDGGATWDTAYSFVIEVPTNTAADTNVVRKTFVINTYGVTDVRLSSVKNNDSANNVTNCNATISF